MSQACPDHDHRPKAERGYPCAHCLEEAWGERDKLRAALDEIFLRSMSSTCTFNEIQTIVSHAKG